MRDAEEALQQQQTQSALDAQGQALQSLQRSLQALADQMMQELAGQQQNGGQKDAKDQSRDPLGRLQNGGDTSDNGDVAVPEQFDIQRAREILNELRRRAGERTTRPPQELDYIERLLQQF